MSLEKGPASPGGEGRLEGDCTASAKPHCLLGLIVLFSEKKRVVIKDQEKQRGLLGVSEKKRNIKTQPAEQAQKTAMLKCERICQAKRAALST